MSRSPRPSRGSAAPSGDRDDTVAPGNDVPRSVYAAVVSSTSRPRSTGSVTASSGGPRSARAGGRCSRRTDDADRQQPAATSMPSEKVSALARRRQRPRDADLGSARAAAVTALAAPLEEDLVGIETEIQGVVAQEALRVDRPGQLAVLAPLEGAEIACPDLRVALGAVEVDALASRAASSRSGRSACGSAGARSGRQPRPGRRSGGATLLGWSWRGVDPDREGDGRSARSSGARIPSRRQRPHGRSAQSPGSSMSSWLRSQLSGP